MKPKKCRLCYLNCNKNTLFKLYRNTINAHRHADCPTPVCLQRSIRHAHSIPLVADWLRRVCLRNVFLLSYWLFSDVHHQCVRLGGNRRRLVSHANCQEQKEASQWQRYEFSCYAVSDFNVTRCSRKYHRHVYRVMRAQAFGHFASKRGTKWQWETCLRCRGSGELAAC